MLTLRPYQTDLIARARQSMRAGCRRACCCSRPQAQENDRLMVMTAYRKNPKPICLCGCGRPVKTHANRYFDRSCVSSKPKRICRVEGCKEPTNKGASGLCGRHYMRVKRYGNTDHVTSKSDHRVLCRLAAPRLGKLKPSTYQKYLGRHLHRQITEQKIGRPLRNGEVVHHRDGDLRNNHPDNLEVLQSQSHHAKRHRSKTQGRFATRADT